MVFERSEPVPLHLMPGYIPNLHQHDLTEFSCATCAEAWPCAGARQQMDDALRFTHPHWFDDESFQNMAARVAAEEEHDRLRRAEKKAAAAAAAQELDELNRELVTD